ncbi:DNA-3-methyladenine glycosylase I [Desulfogranum mediterraneum]|uniref:DNA-3-methyladenine glycosylase I n=1 Tax=Desulfogranum mediterraneum TaxID=160661 RepID=UPI00048FA8D4|nr:DNA-3-methyladenine glycosylase I [Desulfogranum mediterraneum]
MKRCTWVTADPLYQQYHDAEWGVPAHDDRHLFEMLLLEGAQAGLSWLTILKKRENYRQALDDFDPQLIAAYGTDQVERLLADAGIIRNRLKIEAIIKNARGTIKLQEEYGSLDAYLWRYVDGVPLQNRWPSVDKIPTSTALSLLMSKDLKGRGFNFVGPTICYSLMQAIGMVNDHTIDCFRHQEIQQLSR